MLRCALTVLLVGLTCAAGKVVPEENATPKRCCLPDEWEGKVTSLHGLTAPKDTLGQYIISSVYVDAKNTRMRSSAELFDETVGQMHTDMYANKTAIFLVYPAWKTCHKVDLPFLINNCIPDNAIYGGARTYGDSKSPVVTDDWVIFLSGANVAGMARASVTRNQCFPITQLISGVATDLQFMKYDEFFDLKEGIKDPSVFDAPAYCKSAEETTDQKIIEKVKGLMKTAFSL